MTDGRKVRFGPSALVVQLNRLVDEIAAGRQGAEALGVLNDPLERHFDLTDQQRSGVATLSNDQAAIERLKELVVHAAQSEGRERFVVVQHADASSAEGFGHQLLLQRAHGSSFVARMDDSLEAGGDGDVTQAAIAHCDADCGDWGWG